MKKTVRKFKETVEMRASLVNRLRRHRYFPIAVLVSIFLAACVVHVWQRVQVIELVKEVSQLRAENDQLVDAGSKLNARIAALSSAGRIERYAQDSLGLRPAPANHIFTLIGQDEKMPEPDDLAMMFRAIERVTRNVPVIAENTANAGEPRKLKPAGLKAEEDKR